MNKAYSHVTLPKATIEVSNFSTEASKAQAQRLDKWNDDTGQNELQTQAQSTVQNQDTDFSRYSNCFKDESYFNALEAAEQNPVQIDPSPKSRKLSNAVIEKGITERRVSDRRPKIKPMPSELHTSVVPADSETMQDLYYKVLEEKTKKRKPDKARVQGKILPVIKPKGGKEHILQKNSSFLRRQLSERALNMYFSST